MSDETEITEPASLLRSSVDLAMARLDAREPWRLTCWSCGKTDEVPEDPERRVYTCDCGAATAFGSPMPKLAIVPHADRRFVVTKIRQGTGEKAVEIDFTLERSYAAAYAMELLSVTDPARWRAVTAIAAIEAATRKGPEGDRNPGPDGVRLDPEPGFR